MEFIYLLVSAIVQFLLNRFGTKTGASSSIKKGASLRQVSEESWEYEDCTYCRRTVIETSEWDERIER